MKKNTKLSITDVAKALGVSVTTVSFVLNGKGEERNISSSVIRRITEYANKHNYKPQPKRKHVYGAEACAVGVVVEDFLSPNQIMIFNRVGQMLHQHGVFMLMMGVFGKEGENVNVLHAMLQKNVSAFVLMPFSGLDEMSAHLIGKNIPLICYEGNSVEAAGAYDVVMGDYKKALQEAMYKFDLKAGHAYRIGMVTGLSNGAREKLLSGTYMALSEEFSSDVMIKRLGNLDNEVEVQEQIASFILDNKLDVVIFSSPKLSRQGLCVIGQGNLPAIGAVVADRHVTSLGSEVQIVGLELNIEEVASEIVDLLLKKLVLR